ncbi:glycosyltransferase involved in cell wall biosynthesis [Lutibacter oceani]|uniref:Glycosyltransferase involved in cell wall biosynthesis n=1 Tax=Lutibacter oceani TaxID=1853311 RepID=A0A3D9S367_9FLAO|nr:glycosyltransferase family 4 protein [Lutibacter oceani]REE83082.1 glycosyltransferase involved in cell wall biosynthesis [Lutibacter oceani]
MKKKLVRITTVPISLEKLLEGQLGFMKSYYRVIAVSADEKRLIAYGKQENVEVFPVEMTRKITPFKDIIALFKLVRFFKKEQPFIVHTHTPKAGIIGMLAATLANVPNRLHTVAGMPLLEATGFKRKLLNFVEKLTYTCATKVYPNSKGLKEIIINNNFAKTSKLKVLANGSSNGINTAYFNPQLFSTKDKDTLKEQLGIQKNDFVFIFVGRIVGDKGINELVAAFKQLQSNPLLRGARGVLNYSCKLLLVGPFEQDLDPLKKETIHCIENDPTIISVGYQQDVRPYFAISNMLVFPSYREGFPNVVLQAGAMELPSIVTDINGCNEIIIEGKNGWIVPVKNTTALEKEMRNCLVEKDNFNLAKSNARKMIENRYEQKLVWEAILEEYKELEKHTP